MALTLPFSAAAALREGEGAPSPSDHAAKALRPLGHTVLATIASTTGADEALSALGESLAMTEARRRVEANPAPASRVEAPPGDQSRDPALAAEKIVPGDPSTMPPASAGSNGTTVPHHSSVERAKIFANSRAGHDGSTSILLTGIALPPPDAPQAVQDVINNANMIVGRPYIWGGGHGSFYSYGYDCSGSVSFALFGGGMIPRPLTSGELEGWGAPGPGKWITIYANASHTFAEIAGLRWDTSGTESGTGPRWHLGSRPTGDFVVRHPPGY